MGLMYVFPQSDREMSHIDRTGEGVIVYSYGLPSIFWIYLLSLWTALAVMSALIFPTLQTMFNQDDVVNQRIAWSVLLLLLFAPLASLAFFFYQKVLRYQKGPRTWQHRLFLIPLFQRTIQLREENPWEIRHYLDSPNMVRIKNTNLRPQHLPPERYKNQGYFELLAWDQNGRWWRIDRNSSKRDLERLISLLQ